VKRWHLLTPEYPPCCGGVGDYTALLAAGLASAGDRVDVWHAEKVAAKPCSALNIHALPDRFGPRSRHLMDDAFLTDPGIVLVQYVPSAFGRRGFNWPFCRWIGELGRSGADVRVMFHEPFFYFTAKRPWRNALAIAQRGMAATLLRAASHVYYSTSTWTRLLAPYGSPDGAEILPIPATIPTDVRARPEPDALKKRCGEFRVGHFGTYGEHVADQLRSVLRSCSRRSGTRACCSSVVAAKRLRAPSNLTCAAACCRRGTSKAHPSRPRCAPVMCCSSPIPTG